MLTLTNKIMEQVSATDIRFSGNLLYVSLNDGREIRVPMEHIEWLQWLLKASPAGEPDGQLNQEGLLCIGKN